MSAGVYEEWISLKCKKPNSIEWNHKSTQLLIVNANIHHRFEIPVVYLFFKVLQTCLWCIGRWKDLDCDYTPYVLSAFLIYNQLRITISKESILK